MDLGTVLRFLDKHPWVSFATGVGITAVSVMRIRRDSKEKKELKMAKKNLRLLKKERDIET